MEKEFVPYELAVKLKELGFDKPCFGCYLDDKYLCKELTERQDYFAGQEASAPLWQQAFDCFRNEHNFIVSPIKYYQYYFAIEKINKGICETEFIDDTYPLDTYEQARLACLEKLIELVTNK